MLISLLVGCTLAVSTPVTPAESPSAPASVNAAPKNPVEEIPRLPEQQPAFLPSMLVLLAATGAVSLALVCALPVTMPLAALASVFGPPGWLLSALVMTSPAVVVGYAIKAVWRRFTAGPSTCPQPRVEERLACLREMARANDREHEPEAVRAALQDADPRVQLWGVTLSTYAQQPPVRKELAEARMRLRRHPDPRFRACLGDAPYGELPANDRTEFHDEPAAEPGAREGMHALVTGPGKLNAHVKLHGEEPPKGCVILYERSDVLLNFSEDAPGRFSRQNREHPWDAAIVVTLGTCKTLDGITLTAFTTPALPPVTPDAGLPASTPEP